MTLRTRKPTGKPPWPILLLAGRPKAGKSYAAAAASASPMVGRALWIPIGEDDPDELAGIPGADFDVVEHDGTYRDIVQAIRASVVELSSDDTPGLIVVDSMSGVWGLLTDEAQEIANERAARKAAKYGKAVPEDDAPISMDLWNRAKKRWTAVLDILRGHQGPVILTARLDETAEVNDRGEPTGRKQWKVQAHKSLPWDAGAIVEMPEPGTAVLTGCRSLRMPVPVGEHRTLPDFSVEKLWTAMGLADGASTRTHSAATAEQSLRADQSAAADHERRQAVDALYDAWVRSGRGDGDDLSAAFTQRFQGVPSSAGTTEQFRTFLTEITSGNGGQQ